MTTTNPGTVLITGPTGGLGRAATLAMASRPAPERPDLLLVGRAGKTLTQVTDDARAAGATVRAIGCDLARLADVRAAAETAKELLDTGAVRPLRGLVANAGVMVKDTRRASADGYELTFAVNYLAHAQLIADLLGSFAAPARVVLLGSNTYHANLGRKMIGVQPAQWRDPIELARPAPADTSPSIKAMGVAYSNSKLAILYYAHELQRQAPAGISVAVFEPGVMPGTGLGRQAGPAAERIGRGIQRLPGIASPAKSGPDLSSVVLDDRWAHLRDGAFVVRDKERDVKPIAHDPERERRLWDATTELLQTAARADSGGERRS
jgi:NAD(P)-dependent dehydrogenase (short-subunit alcohol dehydrogenase family)